MPSICTTFALLKIGVSVLFDAIQLQAVAGFSLVDGMAEALAGVNEYFAKFSIGDSAIDGCHSTPADLLRKYVPLIYTQTEEGKLYWVEQTDN